MNEKLEKLLKRKYPEILKELDNSESPMYWGIECGNGWYHILDALFETIQNYIDKNNLSQTHTVQVKEKFGSLRVYLDFEDIVIHELVNLAESISERVCELCGAPGKLRNLNGWYKTLCRKCYKEAERDV